MNNPAETEDRLRADLAEMADAVVARSDALADGAEARAGQAVRRRRAWLAFGAAATVALAAIAVPTWLVGVSGSAAPSTQPSGTPTSSVSQVAPGTAQARCQALVEVPNSDFTRVLAASATTGAGLLEWLGHHKPGDPAWQREAASLDPAAHYVVCGLVDPHAVPTGYPGIPPHHGSWAVSVIVSRSGRPITNSLSTRADVRDGVEAVPPAGAQQRCAELRDAPRSGYTRLLIWRAVTGAQLRHWLRTREGGVYSRDVVRRYDPELHYAVCGLVDPTQRPSMPCCFDPPRGVIVVLPPTGAPIVDSMGPPSGIVDLVALLP